MQIILQNSACYGTLHLPHSPSTLFFCCTKTPPHTRFGKYYPEKKHKKAQPITEQINLKPLTFRVVQLTRRRQLRQIFEEIDTAKKQHGELNIIVMNAVMQACVHCGDIEAALRVFDEMSNLKGCGVDDITYGTLLKGLADAGRIDEAFQLLESVELGTAVGSPQLSQALICGLLNALIVSGDLLRANGVLAKYCHVLQEDGSPSILSFNLLMKGYIIAGCPEAAIGIHDEITRRGLNPDRLTYNTLIFACVKTGNLRAATQIFEQMKDKAQKDDSYEICPDIVTYTTLLKGFGQVNDKFSLEKILIEMKSSKSLCIDRVAYTTMVDALLNCGSIEGALCVFGEIVKQTKFKPKPHLFLSLMRAFATRGDYGMVRRLRERIWVDSAGKISVGVQEEADQLLMEAALNEGQVDLALQNLKKVIRKWTDMSWSSRGGMVALRLEALMGLNTSMLSPRVLPQVSLSDEIERIMIPYHEARPLQSTLQLSQVVMRFFKDSVVPIVDDRGGCVGILHREDCNKLDAPLSTLMRSPPPCVTSSTSVGYVIDLMLEKKYKMIVIIKYGDFQGISYNTSLRAIGFFSYEDMCNLPKYSSKMTTDNRFQLSKSNIMSIR